MYIAVPRNKVQRNQKQLSVQKKKAPKYKNKNPSKQKRKALADYSRASIKNTTHHGKTFIVIQIHIKYRVN